MNSAARIVATIICFSFVALAPGCATFGPPAIDIGECAVAKVCQQVAQIKPQVLNCLNTGEYRPCLESIGKTVGEAILVCAVREFAGVGATPASDPIVRQRASDFLATKNLKGG